MDGRVDGGCKSGLKEHNLTQSWFTLKRHIWLGSMTCIFMVFNYFHCVELYEIVIIVNVLSQHGQL